MRKTNFQHYLLLISAYLFLLAWNGYTYGHGDTIEVFPYAKWLNDNTLYPQDFFIQNTIQHVPNERYILAQFFSWTGNAMPWIAFLLHFLCSIFLLEGLFRITKKYITSEFLIWIAILLPISIFYGKNLGGNEMYIPLFTSSTLAKAIGIWAIYFFLDLSADKAEKKDNNILLVYTLLAIAAFIQPIVSIQLFVILTGVILLSRFDFPSSIEFDSKNLIQGLTESQTLKKTALGIVLYIFTAGVWIFLMNKNFASGEIEKALLFDFFEFRVPHHYMPSYFPIKNYIALGTLFFIGIYFFYKKEKKVFWFFVLVLLGLVFYTLGVEVFQISSIMAAQWFKTTIWLKAFSFIAILSFLEKLIPKNLISFFEKIKTVGLVSIGVFSIYIILNPFARFNAFPYDLPVFQSQNAERNISELAKKHTPKDALFIIPMNNTHFKHYAERSTYIDYKAVIHRKSVIPIWYQRIQEVYGIDIKTRQAGRNQYAVGNDFYKKRTLQDLEAFAKKGIDYWITFKDVDLPLEKIVSNEKYVIYKL